MFRELIRKHKQLTAEECIHVLKTERRGVLSVIGDNGYPYGMPMNHWYNEEDGCIYFHCGKGGHRTESLQKHDKVSFCVFEKGTKTEGDWALSVRSVIVFGKIEIIDGVSKITALVRAAKFKGCSYNALSAYELAEKAKAGNLSLPLIVYDLDDSALASDTKLLLGDLFGEETAVL